jgi:hypothetical protein
VQADATPPLSAQFVAVRSSLRDPRAGQGIDADVGDPVVGDVVRRVGDAAGVGDALRFRVVVVVRGDERQGDGVDPEHVVDAVRPGEVVGGVDHDRAVRLDPGEVFRSVMSQPPVVLFGGAIPAVDAHAWPARP